MIYVIFASILLLVCVVLWAAGETLIEARRLRAKGGSRIGSRSKQYQGDILQIRITCASLHLRPRAAPDAARGDSLNHGFGGSRISQQPEHTGTDN